MRMFRPVILPNLHFLQFNHIVNGIPNHFPENCVFILQFLGRRHCEEKLTSVVVLSGVRHGHKATPNEP